MSDAPKNSAGASSGVAALPRIPFVVPPALAFTPDELAILGGTAYGDQQPVTQHNRRRLLGPLASTTGDHLDYRPFSNLEPAAIKPGRYLCRLIYGENFRSTRRGTYGFRLYMQLLTGEQAGEIAIHLLWRTKPAEKHTLAWLRKLSLPRYAVEHRILFTGGGCIATFKEGTLLHNGTVNLGYRLSDVYVCEEPEPLHQEFLDRHLGLVWDPVPVMTRGTHSRKHTAGMTGLAHTEK